MNVQKDNSKSYKILRAVTIAFAVVGLAAIVVAAVVSTLYYTGWWLGFFALYFGAYTVMFGTLYLSLLALLVETTYRAYNKYKTAVELTFFEKITHRVIRVTALAGIVTFIPFALPWFDVLSNGIFIILHSLCCVILVLSYIILGIHIVRCRANNKM